MPKLYAPHTQALTTMYGDIENFARSQGQVTTGTPGGVYAHSNAAGYKYYVHQFYDARGKKVETYLAGPVGDKDADAKAEEFRNKLQALAGAVKNIRLLAREGFKFVDSKSYATIATLHNHGLFQAGAMLIGSHAYGTLLNELGVRAAQYATQDLDIARNAKLAFDKKQGKLSFLDMLKSSGISFFEVPSMDTREPSSSFKETGKSFFQVDLLVPSADERIGIVPVPELKAHATALPYLRYLLGESQDATVLAREGCCAVRVPTPERFALHKLIVSQLRKRGEKSLKDVSQAAVLLAVLSEWHPRALEEAADAVPKSARSHLTKAAVIARDALDAHPRAIEALDAITSIVGNDGDDTIRRQQSRP